MKKRILVALGIYSVIFLLGGIYIISTTGSSTSTLNHLIKLYKIETQRLQLLISLRDVQFSLNLRGTDHAKGAETIVANVRSMARISDTCFTCHHEADVYKDLFRLREEIEAYKGQVSRVLTIRASRERLKAEDDKAFNVAQQLMKDISGMVHAAMVKLSDRTQFSLDDISRSNGILFVLVGLTPIFVAGLGFVFIRGLTRPIKALLTATRRLDAGHLEYRIEGLTDEFGEVAASFNDMTSRLGTYTHRLEEQTEALERSHNQVSTFFDVLKKIGSQETLDGVGAVLMREIQRMVDTPHSILYVFSTVSDTLYTISPGGTRVFQDEGPILAARKILEGSGKAAISPRLLFEASLLPEGFPGEGHQSVIPFRIPDYATGALVSFFSGESTRDAMDRELVGLVLEQSAGTIKRAILHREEVHALEQRIEKISGFGGIIGKDDKMKAIYMLIEDISPTDTTVLIEGESGTGKEMVAHAIHTQSNRKGKPFVVIDCSGFPETLLESELFGYEKGAFTGAVRQKIGRFELADGGTVFLDEVGEISPTAQIKLLRVLQTRKFERIGGEETIEVDVRILAATNRDLLKDARAGRFREDLWYRLNVIPIKLPPLRTRRNDIPLLARHFLQKYSTEQDKTIEGFSPEAMQDLMSHHWPGNVRELENAIEHAVVLCKGGPIEVSHLPVGSFGSVTSSNPPALAQSPGTIEENEKVLLQNTLGECNWNKKRTAIQLGISRSTLYEKIKRYSIVQPSGH